MNTLKQYEEIANHGSKEEVGRIIADLELQKRRNNGVLDPRSEEILVMLKNSLNWIKPVNLFDEVVLFSSPLNEL